jgi:hypothetical protein
MRKPLIGLVVVVAVLSVPAAAWAHDPLFIEDTTPTNASPLIEDGAISFATYGQISTPGEDAAFRLRLAEGQTLGVDLLVPDRAPENARVDYRHLHLTIVDPGGRSTELNGGAVQERFDEPFSKTSYLRLLRYSAPAAPGITTIIVRSDLPTRFTVATGQIEKFGTAVSDYERKGLDALTRWYDTPPPDAPRATSPPAPRSAAPSESSNSSPSATEPVPTVGTPTVAAMTAPSSALPVAVGVAVALTVVAGIVLVFKKRDRSPRP